MKTQLALLISFAAAISQAQSPLPHPFTIQDMVRLDRVSGATASPDGQWIAFSKKTWDPEANKNSTHLWLVSADGNVTRQLTNEKYTANFSPTWAPDSKSLAFISTQGEGGQQIWVMDLQSGQKKQLTRFPVDVDNLQWSPAGDHFAFSAEIYPDAQNFEESTKREKAKTESKITAMKFDRLMVRHWDTWFNAKRNHIFVLPLKKEGTSAWSVSGEPSDLTRGVDADAPTRPFGGSEEFSWSQDGKEIAYTMQTGADHAWSTDLNVYTVSLDGSAAKCITCENKATDTTPVYSPDGSSIAYLAMARPGFESDRLRIKIYDRKSGTTRTLTEKWDRSVGSLKWSADSKKLLVSAEEGARKKIFEVDVASGQAKEIVGEHYNSDVAYLGKESILYTQDSFSSPADIWVAAKDGAKKTQLTYANAQVLKDVQMSEPEEFFFNGALKQRVQAWLFKPVGFKDGEKYPVAFIIHGGPQSTIADHFHYRWNPQTYTGAGYAVIIVNFHGSPGFGQAFTDSISGDWGGKPFEDLMKGLDHALANYKWLDKNRVAALGASYGGWMINWINGHTNRFKCLVNHDGMFDTFDSYFTTEELWFPEWEFKGVPWEKPRNYDRFSPARYVAKWKTPTLVIHGGKDYRLVDTSGIATFTALQRRGIPSEFLYFPDENHWVLKPKNSIIWHDTVLAWLKRWL